MTEMNMIEINLAPEELKTKPRDKKTGFGLEPRYFIYLLPAVLGLLIFVHIYLAGLLMFKNSQLSSLNKKWQGMTSQRKVLDDFNKEYSLFSSEAQSVKQLSQRRVTWAKKLNNLSLSLPSGIWFREVSITPKDFTLHGSAVSLQKVEMGLIKQFMDNLKHDSGFFSDFTTLELSSVQKKTIGGYEVAEFILTGALKAQ
ncbi:MAG: hypothetical protein A3K83_07630 [Omnitrophica WOR_2 bacterium RBG_13_44_8b]|nr:MAG: hypothetical protein A3K83_07630 [Omnitrophica WOR_2 bacterium RBG_13_44_8b]